MQFIITIGFLLVYTFLTGASISTVRAVLMCSIVLMSPILNRKSNPLNGVFFTATILLLYEPLYIFRPGFIMSFFSVTGIIVLTPNLESFFTKLFHKIDYVNIKFIGKFLIPYISVTISAFIFVTPIISYYFYYIYPYSIFVNIFIIFTLPFLIILSFLVGIISFIFFPLAWFLSGTIYYIFQYYQLICTIFKNFPFSKIITGSPSILFLCIYYSLILFIIYFKKILNIKTKMLILLTFLLFTFLFKTVTSRGFNITFLNYKSSAIVFYDNRKTYILDGPTKNNNIINYINSIGKNKVDGVFITKLDKENTTNSIYLIKNNFVNNIYISDINYLNNDFYNLLVQIANDYNVNIIKISNKTFLDIGNIKINLDDENFKLVYNNNITFYYENNSEKNIVANILVYRGNENLDNVNTDILISTNNTLKNTNNIKITDKNIYLKIINNKVRID